MTGQNIPGGSTAGDAPCAAQPAQGHDFAIELRDINKHFGPVHANKDVCLRVRKGSVHGIIGENGAGKSTLMSILYGYYQASSGTIFINGRETNIRDPQAAIAAGIGMVFQHFKLVDTFTVLENIVLGAEGGFLLAEGVRAARAALQRLEREYELQVDIDAVVGDLSVGLLQRVEILKALYRGADILVLDEPTGVLTPQEADHLFRILAALKAQGKTIVFITHKLREIMAITDYVSVMRHGEMVAHRVTAETSPEELAELMVGRKVLLRVDKTPAHPAATVLETDNLAMTDANGVQRLKGVSFSVRAGEIVGIAGVAGNGQSELLEVLAGMQPPSGGRFVFNGHAYDAAHPADARGIRAQGLGHVPEDRNRLGLVSSFSAAEAAILGRQDDPLFNGLILMDERRIRENCLHLMEKYDVRPVDPALPAANFSGGNQQKIVLAREIERDPDLLLVGQPTRGVDIGAIEFIHRRIIEMRDAGKAVLLVSVELDEIMSLSDRILVMFDGIIVGEVDPAEADEKLLGLMMAGVDPRRDGPSREGAQA